MDHYAADANAVFEHLDLRNPVHIGHSTGGGQATRYVAPSGFYGIDGNRAQLGDFAGAFAGGTSSSVTFRP